MFKNLTILNVNLRQKLEVARAHADALYQLNQGDVP